MRLATLVLPGATAGRARTPARGALCYALYQWVKARYRLIAV